LFVADVLCSHNFNALNTNLNVIEQCSSTLCSEKNTCIILFSSQNDEQIYTTVVVILPEKW